MNSTLVLSSILMALPGQADGRAASMLGGKPAAKPEAAKDSSSPPAVKADGEEDSARALAQYNALKEKARHTVADQSKLAAWCEQHGLKAEAYVHYAEVVRLDPGREAAWRKLGYKKYGNRWMTAGQIAEAEGQKKTDRVWAPQLKKIHKDIHGSRGAKRRDEARAAFEAIRDAKAIPSLYREFGGSQADQILLIEALERIDRPIATRVLAMLAVYGRTPEVRRRATEYLCGRRADEYLELLVDLLVDTLKYEVRHVAGPGSPGVLFVEGERFNTARFYAPPPPPNIVPRPGDLITYDPSGMPVITRMMGVAGRSITRPGHRVEGFEADAVAQYSARRMTLEAQKGAALAESQLQADVARVKAVDDVRRQFNDLVISVASYATGKNFGPDPKDWRKAVNAAMKYSEEPRPTKPTLTELVPLTYQPQFAQIGFMHKPIVDS